MTRSEQRQSRLSKASFSLSDSDLLSLSSDAHAQSSYEFLIHTLQKLHRIPPSAYIHQDSLEDCLEQNLFHYRPAELSVLSQAFEQVTVLAKSTQTEELVVLRKNRKKFQQFSRSSTQPELISISCARREYYPCVYEIYPIFPSGPLTLLKLFTFVYPAISGELVRAGLISFLLIILSLASPIITAHVVGDVVPSGNLSWIFSTFIISILLALYQSTFNYLQSFYFMRLNQKLRLRLQIPLFARILSYPIEFLENYTVGDLSSRASSVSSVITSLSSSTLSSLIGSLSLVGYTALMFYYDSSLSMWALLIVFISISTEVYFSRIQLRYQRQMMEGQSDMYEQTLQMLGALPQIRSNAAEPFILSQWYNKLLNLSSISLKSQKLGDYSSAVSSIVNIAGTTTIYLVLVTRLFAASSLEAASLSTTTFIVFTGAFSGFASRASSLIGLFNSLLGSVWVQWKRAIPLIQQSEEVGLTGTKQQLQLSGLVRFKNVSFSYPSSSQDSYVLNDLSFTLHKGKFNVLFGPSGCGKSTIVSLLLGFYKVSKGSIFFDDISIDDVDIRYHRRQIGTILQQPTLPAGSVRDALTSGLYIDDSLIWAALGKVNLFEEINALPMKLETVLSEGASNISGGQRQRLCIARAILNNPRILIEDEATSALDTKSQSIVSASLRQEAVTRIVIAHRLSAVASCDHMIVINNGKIECEGSFTHCLANSAYLRHTIDVNQQ